MSIVNNPWLGFFRVNDLPVREPWDIETYPPKKKRKRQMTLARAMRQAREAGLAVSAVTVNADGSVTLLFGEAAPQSNGATGSEWDEVLK
jgi:hypothetical protein